MTSRQIDEKVSELARKGQQIFLLNEKKVADARPDLIIGQGICDVCSPYKNELSSAVAACETKPDVLVLNPTTLNDIFESIMIISSKVGRETEGRELVASLERRLNSVAKRAAAGKKRVLCVEWLNPLFTAGHWVPEIVELAGGINLASRKGEHSRRLNLEEASRLDPDVLMLMPCGFDVGRTLEEMDPLISSKEWNSLRAVRNGDVYALDSNAYFSKPSPRVITGLEILAKILGSDTRVPRGSYKKLAATASARLRYRHRQVS